MNRFNSTINSLKGLISPIAFFSLPSTNKDTIKSEKGGKKKRFSKLIHKTKDHKAELGQDKLDEAIEKAEDPYYPSRQDLYKFYHQTVSDAHIKREIRNARIAVTGEPFGLFSNGIKADDKKTKLLEAPWLRKYISLMLDAEWWGHTVVEFQKMQEGSTGIMEFNEVKLFPREHINPVTGEILIHPHAIKGIPYREDETVNTWILESDDSEDLGLLEIATREYIWKRFSRSDWATRSERYGMPMLSILTDETDEKELDAKLKMGQNLGSNGVYVGDKDDELAYLESKQSGGYEIYERLCRYTDEQNSKLFNGTVIGENSQGGSRSKEEVGERILDGYAEDRLRAMQNHINSKLIPFLIRHGYPLEGYTFKYYELIKIDERRKNLQAKDQQEKKTEQKEDQETALLNMYNDNPCC